MSSDSKPRERLDQKLRTRAQLLRAARELLSEGKTPTVAAVADAAMVSRATAYRYFPNPEALLAEVPLDLAAPTVESLFGAGAPSDPEDRVALVHNAFYDLCREHDSEWRLFLRASIMRSLQDPESTGDPFRGARRVALLDEALAPLANELPPDQLEQLKTALAMLVGGESVIVLRDVLRLDHDQARARGERAVRELIRAARQRPSIPQPLPDQESQVPEPA
ncbi:MAG: TetR/AcrR family transcriptional regulator [Solirubrobacterales bacterium]|nr:TetR/AcrR family transcriptional regulator [Solirubrobacterales bacterium]